jgi:hypothetical protein
MPYTTCAERRLAAAYTWLANRRGGWKNRPSLRLDRVALRDRGDQRKERLGQQQPCCQAADDVVARFTIEQESLKLRFITHLPGGWC